MPLQPLWPCSSVPPTSHISVDGEEQWSLEQWLREVGGNNSSGTAVLGMAACRIRGVVKGRDRHRVTSDAALLMGWAVSQSQHPQNSAHQPALVKVPRAAASSSLWSVTAAAHPSRASGGIPQMAAAAGGRDGWGKPAQPWTSLQCRTGEGSLGSRLLDDICVCAHHGTLTSTALLIPARALRPAAHISDEFMYSLCSADAGPGMFPHRDVSSLDKICTLTFEVNNLQVGILFLQRKPFPPTSHNQNWAPSPQRSHFGVSGNSPYSYPTYPCALAFGEQQQGGPPMSSLNSALVSPFFYIPRKS